MKEKKRDRAKEKEEIKEREKGGKFKKKNLGGKS